jgi:hypothetical protein
MSFGVFAQIAERRIAEAMNRGEFENLEGSGRPLVFEDDSMVPEDLRMAYKILRNSGYVPPEILEEKEILTAADLLARPRTSRSAIAGCKSSRCWSCGPTCGGSSRYLWKKVPNTTRR